MSASRTTCSRCGKSWGGYRAEHCPACHETFSGTTAGDRHRVGEHATGRRCLTPDEMRAVGMRLVDRGGDCPVWVGEADPRFHDAGQSAEQTVAGTERPGAL